MRMTGRVAIGAMLMLAGLVVVVPGLRQVFGSDATDAASRSRRIVGELRPVAFGASSASVAELHRRGWLECDGRTLPQSDYPELYGAIGDSWGRTKKGQFRLPDLRGALFRGVSSQRNREIQKELLGPDYVVSRPGSMPEGRTRPDPADVTYFIYAGAPRPRPGAAGRS